MIKPKHKSCKSKTWSLEFRSFHCTPCVATGVAEGTFQDVLRRRWLPKGTRPPEVWPNFHLLPWHRVPKGQVNKWISGVISHVYIDMWDVYIYIWLYIYIYKKWMSLPEVQFCPPFCPNHIPTNFSITASPLNCFPMLLCLNMPFAFVFPDSTTAHLTIHFTCVYIRWMNLVQISLDTQTIHNTYIYYVITI